jgi:hypothetical protein
VRAPRKPVSDAVVVDDVALWAATWPSEKPALGTTANPATCSCILSPNVPRRLVADPTCVQARPSTFGSRTIEPTGTLYATVPFEMFS